MAKENEKLEAQNTIQLLDGLTGKELNYINLNFDYLELMRKVNWQEEIITESRGLENYFERDMQPTGEFTSAIKTAEEAIQKLQKPIEETLQQKLDLEKKLSATELSKVNDVLKLGMSEVTVGSVYQHYFPIEESTIKDYMNETDLDRETTVALLASDKLGYDPQKSQSDSLVSAVCAKRAGELNLQANKNVTNQKMAGQQAAKSNAPVKTNQMDVKGR